MRPRRTPPLRPLCAALTLAPAPGPQELALGFSASHVASRTRTSPLCPPRAPLPPPRAPSGTCPDALTLPAQHTAALGTERAPERERPPVVASPRGTDGHPPRTEQSGWRGSVPPTAGLLWSSLYARTAPDSAASAKASTTGTGTPDHAAPPAPHHAPATPPPHAACALPGTHSSAAPRRCVGRLRSCGPGWRRPGAGARPSARAPPGKGLRGIAGGTDSPVLKELRAVGSVSTSFSPVIVCA